MYIICATITIPISILGLSVLAFQTSLIDLCSSKQTLIWLERAVRERATPPQATPHGPVPLEHPQRRGQQLASTWSLGVISSETAVSAYHHLWERLPWLIYGTYRTGHSRHMECPE